MIINWRDCTREDVDMARKLKPPLVPAQNNAMRTNYIKVLIDNTQQNFKNK